MRTRGASRAGKGTTAAPWPKIGAWAGGVFGALVATPILFLTFADWNALRGPISRFASAATGREISIRGGLYVDPWRLDPLIRGQGLHIGIHRSTAIAVSLPWSTVPKLPCASSPSSSAIWISSASISTAPTSRAIAAVPRCALLEV